MTNIKCRGNKEIDLLAMNPKTNEKYHVEARVSTTFSLKEKYVETAASPYIFGRLSSG
jgi:nucleoid DNA-binding protein